MGRRRFFGIGRPREMDLAAMESTDREQIGADEVKEKQTARRLKRRLAFNLRPSFSSADCLYEG